MEIRNRGYRRRVKHRKERRLRNIILKWSGYSPHIGYIEEDLIDGKWVPVGKYVKYPRNSNAQRFLKRRTNRAARRCDLPPKGNSYRKCKEYWWDLY